MGVMATTTGVYRSGRHYCRAELMADALRKGVSVEGVGATDGEAREDCAYQLRLLMGVAETAADELSDGEGQ